MTETTAGGRRPAMTSGELSVILDEAEIRRLHAERVSLQVQYDAVSARIREIDRALVASGEARLRAKREAEEKFHRERCGACLGEDEPLMVTHQGRPVDARDNIPKG